jgi:hypothetical protein
VLNEVFGIPFELDADVSACRSCDRKLGWEKGKRRHHCRFCGKIFCRACLEKQVHEATEQEEKCCKNCKAKDAPAWLQPSKGGAGGEGAELDNVAGEEKEDKPVRVLLRDQRRSQHGLQAEKEEEGGSDLAGKKVGSGMKAKRPTAVATGLAPVAPPPPAELKSPTDAMDDLWTKYTKQAVVKEDPDLLLAEEVDSERLNSRNNLSAYLKKTETERDLGKGRLGGQLKEHPIVKEKSREEVQKKWQGGFKKMKGFLVFGSEAKAREEERRKQEAAAKEERERVEKAEKGIRNKLKSVFKLKAGASPKRGSWTARGGAGDGGRQTSVTAADTRLPGVLPADGIPSTPFTPPQEESANAAEE